MVEMAVGCARSCSGLRFNLDRHQGAILGAQSLQPDAGEVREAPLVDLTVCL